MLELKGNRGLTCVICGEQNGPGIGFTFLVDNPVICQKCLFSVLVGDDRDWAQNTEQYRRNLEKAQDRVVQEQIEEKEDANSKEEEFDAKEKGNISGEGKKGDERSPGLMEKAVLSGHKIWKGKN